MCQTQTQLTTPTQMAGRNTESSKELIQENVSPDGNGTAKRVKGNGLLATRKDETTIQGHRKGRVTR